MGCLSTAGYESKRLRRRVPTKTPMAKARPPNKLSHMMSPADHELAEVEASEERPAAIAEASRNAIQEAKKRKAAARARMAERRNASS